MPVGHELRLRKCRSRRLNLRFVEAYYWVVTLKSVTRAAEKLHLTQSAMSSRIAALEQELGTLLLDRRDKQFRVTIAGQRFFGHAERLLALQRDIKAELGTSAAEPVLLRLGAFESALHSWLMAWVAQLHATQTGMAMELTVETSPVLIDQLARGTIDLAIAALPAAGSGVRSLALPTMPMAFVGHARHHRRRQWTLADLCQGELLTFQRGSQPHVALLDALHQARLVPPRIHTVSSISAMAQLVEDGFGVATLPTAVVDRMRASRSLKILPCDVKLAPLPVQLSWRIDPSSAAQQPVIDSLLNYLGVNPNNRKNR
jgi:DNA-binding transcriptional LysR family regulator